MWKGKDMSVWIIWLIPSATMTLWNEFYHSALGTCIINLKMKEIQTRGNFFRFPLHGCLVGVLEFWMLWSFIAGDDFKNTAEHVPFKNLVPYE